MSRHVRLLAIFCALVSFFCSAARAGVPAPTIWSGPNITFSKAGNVSPNLPENQDRMTDNVWITRGGASSGGPFNITIDAGYDFGTNNIAGTEWATELIGLNAGMSITAENYANLDFGGWAEAFGGPDSDLIENILVIPAVVHLIEDDIYLNLQFIDFNSQGLMIYERSTPAAVATPTGDYNGDTIVDALDYTVWRNNFGDETEVDINFSGDGENGVDEADFDVWKLNYGETVPGGGSGGLAVPEPATFVFALAVAVVGAIGYRRRR